MRCEQIHETVVRDIVDVISDVKDSDEVKWMRNRKNSFSSIAKASSDLTLVFPVVVPRSLNTEDAAMITKAIERKATSMLQILFSAIQVVDNVDDAFDYIKNFHTNIKMDDDITVDQFIDFMDRYGLDESSPIQIKDKERYYAIREDLKNLNYFLPDSIEESSINDVFKLHNGEVIQEARKKLLVATKANGKTINNNIGKISQSSAYNNGRPTSNGSTAIVNINTPKQTNGRGGAIDGGLSQIQKNKADVFKNQILDSDVKKANELMPTLMVINFLSTDGETVKSFSDVIIGIKAKMYVVESMDIINRIIAKNNDNNGLLQFVRSSTREISFFKDFLFAIDKAKLDALSSSRRGSSSKLWKVLERRALKSKIRRAYAHTNDASAITTLVITQEEVEYLKSTENIDMEKEKTARPIMEAYNLMGICIINEIQEYAKFLFDTGDDMYETISFNHLERESSDSSTKKIVNLMAKMNK